MNDHVHALRDGVVHGIRCLGPCKGMMVRGEALPLLAVERVHDLPLIEQQLGQGSSHQSGASRHQPCLPFHSYLMFRVLRGLMPFHHNNSKFAFVLTATVSFLRRGMVWSLVVAHAMVMHGQGIDVNAEGMEAVGFLGLNALEATGVNDMASWFDETEQVTYLLVGCDNGTAFVRLLPGGSPCTWASCRRPRFPAFGVTSRSCMTTPSWSQADNHGMQVFDLEHLRDWSPLDGPVVWGSTSVVAAPRPQLGGQRRCRSGHSIGESMDVRRGGHLLGCQPGRPSVARRRQ